MRPAAFFFDLDGTLVDTEMAWARAIARWLVDQGQETSPQQLLPILIGRSWLDIHAAIHAAFPELPATSALDDSRALRSYYAAVVADPAALVIDSSVAFFRRAARIAPCAIVSGSPHADVEEAARFCGLSHLTRFVLGCDDCTAGKPAPDCYLKAAEMMDVDASECVVVEDSSAGVLAGRKAGMNVVGLDRNPAIPQDFTGCTWLVHDLSELDVAAVFGD